MNNFFKKLHSIFNRFDGWCETVFDGFFAFFRKYLLVIAGVMLFALSLGIRFSFIGYRSGDFNSFIVKWMTFLDENGGFLALKYYPNFTPQVCDYPIAYINLLAFLTYIPIDYVVSVKISSFVFDYLLSLGTFLLVNLMTESKGRAFISAVIIAFMPTCILNSAVWGQCDALWVCGIVWSLYFILKGKCNFSMAILGLAFANKPQAVFFLPAVMFFWVNKKIKLRNLLMIPIVYFLTFVPGYIVGTPFAEPFKMFITQLGRYPNANYGAANMYSFMQFSRIYSYINNGGGVLFAFSAIAIMMLILYRANVKSTRENMVWEATIFVILTPFVLPHMHERYLFVVDVFVVIYAIIMNKKYWLIPAMQISSVLCYTHFLFGDYIIKTFGEDCVKIATIITFTVLTAILYEFKNVEKDGNKPLINSLGDKKE